MKKIITIPYDEIQFHFVSDHYDVHLSGICIYKKKLYFFKTIVINDTDNQLVDVFKLTYLEKIKWFLKQRWFEMCVGKHYSFKDNKKIQQHFFYRKPKFLFKILFDLYYKHWKKLIF